MPKTIAERVSVTILDRSYQLACPPEEKAMLMECVALVDSRMRAVKAEGKLQAPDRIAVMAALVIAREFLSSANASEVQAKEMAIQKITQINKIIEAALVPQERLF